MDARRRSFLRLDVILPSMRTHIPHKQKPIMKTTNQLQAEYDAKLAELDRLIAENNAKRAANHLAMQAAIADAQSAIATAIERLSK